MVRLAGIEPARLAARDFKSLVSTYFTTLTLFFNDDFLFVEFTIFFFVYYTFNDLICQR